MTRSISYPHPVLGNNDDIDGQFEFSPEIELGDNILISGNFELANDGVKNLVDSGEACFLLGVDCRATYFRTSLKVSSPRLEYSIVSDRLRNKVVLHPMIIATRQIENYLPTDAHSDYADAAFRIQAGQYLALGDTLEFIAEKDFDPLKMPCGSIMQIGFKESMKREEPFQFFFSADKIHIWLSKEIEAHYQGVKRDVPSSILSMIAIPVLAEAIRRMRDKDESQDFLETMWHNQVDQVIQSKNLSDLSPLETAQKILEAPLTRTLDQMDSQLSRGDLNDAD